MPLVSASVAVNATAAPLYRQTVTAPTTVIITNLDPSVDLILGSAGLTRTTFGFQVNKGGNHQEITLNYGDTIYGMTASGSTPITVNVLANVSNA